MFEFGLAFPREVGAVAVRVAEHCDPYVPRVLKSKWTLAAVCALAVALRMAEAIAFPGYEYPDEIFQVLEQAHRLAFGNGIIPWEFAAAAIEMDDRIRAHRHRGGCDLLWSTTFSPPPICARRSSRAEDAILGSLAQRMGLPRGSGPAGGWNRLGPEQETSDSGSLDWRINDRLHSVSISDYAGPR